LPDFRNWLGLETQVVDPASDHGKSRDYTTLRASLYKLIGSQSPGFATRIAGYFILSHCFRCISPT
jgi:hypothetical protein